MLELSTALDQFTTVKTLAGNSEKTIESYEYAIGGLGEFLQDDPDVSEITTDDIRNYYQHLLEERELSKTTVAIQHRTLQSFFNWLVSEDKLEEAPTDTVQEPKTPKRYPRVLEQKHVDQLFDSMKERINTWVGLRNYVMVMFMLDTGVRRGELIGASLQDLNLEGLYIKVHGKGAKDRRVYFGRRTRMMINRWLRVRESIKAEIEDETLFIGMNGERLKDRNVNRLINRIQDRAGLNHIKVSPHVFRHTSATMAIENGMDPYALREQFGWEDIQTSFRYLHMTGKRLKEAYRKTSPMDHYEPESVRKRRNKRGEWVNK